MNFKDELNEEQYAAVTAPDGPALVIAAAGTGKTRTLVYRVAWLLEQGVDPNRILLLTFTNKAAKEMLERARQLTGDAISGILGGTFHHLANRILRRFASQIGFGNDFTILDSDDSKKLIKSCADDFKMDKKAFPKPQVLLSILSVVNGRDSDLYDEVVNRFENTDVNYEDVIRVTDEYQVRKKAQNAMDFDDLLIYALQLFRTSDRVRWEYQEKFQYVLVDEYQDTNVIQAEWINLLSGKHNNLMVVGDDFQSIYSWRGANFRNFLEFDQRYPGTNQYKLLTNYRSTPEILDVANAAIAGNPEQFQKELRATRAEGAQPVFCSPRDGGAQARYIIEKAQEFHRKGIALTDMCILYRAHFHAMELQMELARASMPYVVTSGTRFFEQAHIKDACSVLRILANPADQLAFTRLLELFPKVGAKTSLKIFRKLGERANLQREETCAELAAALPAGARDTWKKIEPVFLAYRAENLDNDPGEIIYRFNKAFYNEYMTENFENSKYRAEDIDGLIDFTTKFKSTEEFLSEITLLSNLDAEGETSTADNAAPADSIRLSTIHQAKGLEFKVVFILFLSEGMFPGAKSVEENGDAEERRLFYVAVTRAEDQLFLCAPEVRRQHDGGLIHLEPSRFIREIPQHLLKMDFGGNSYMSNPPPSYRQPAPSKQSIPAFKKTLNSSHEVQNHLEEKETTVSQQIPLEEISFSKGIATIPVLLNRYDLPEFQGYKDEEIPVRDPIFQESVNHLSKYLHKEIKSLEISITIQVRYNRSAVSKITLLENNLFDVLHSCIEENIPSATAQRLTELAANNVSFTDSDKLFPEDTNCFGVHNDNDAINALVTRRPGQKHTEQINYLSSKHCSQYGKLRIGTDNSLLCILKGETHIFVVWEMFDENYATYLWKIKTPTDDTQNNLDTIRHQLDDIETHIGTIKEEGRQPYRKENIPIFFHIDHTYNTNGTADFSSWEKKLIELLARS